jgi:hypothetical protein
MGETEKQNSRGLPIGRTTGAALALVFILMVVSWGVIPLIGRYINNYDSFIYVFGYRILSIATVILDIVILIVGVIILLQFKKIGQFRFFPEDPTSDGIAQIFRNDIVSLSGDAIAASRVKAIVEIDRRVKNLQSKSTVILLTIGGLLISAALIVIFAGQLTNLDASAASNVDRISAEVSNIQYKGSRFAEILDRLEKNERGDQKDRISVFVPGTSWVDGGNIDFGGSVVRSESLPSTISSAKYMTEVNNRQLSNAEGRLAKAWDKELSADKGYSDTKYLVVTTITRVTVVLVIVFLVQILVGLYRYNYRLATFYNSRRDILRVWDGSIASLEKLEKITAVRSITE